MITAPQQTERQRAFRRQYVAQISPWYNGLVHVGVMYAAGISAIWWCVSRMQGATWEWLLVVPVAIAGNFVEWGMHKYVMHRLVDVFALRAIYDRHTRQHHQYFTDGDPTIGTVQEFRIVFFPWRVLMVLAVGGGVFGWIASRADQRQRRLRRLHHHDRPLHGVRDVPLLLPHPGELVAAPHPARQHDPAPPRGAPQHGDHDARQHEPHAADRRLGDEDERPKRGLFGHLFNGYDEAHVKDELKPVMARFRTAETQAQRVTLDGPKLNDDELMALGRAGGHA